MGWSLCLEYDPSKLDDLQQYIEVRLAFAVSFRISKYQPRYYSLPALIGYTLNNLLSNAIQQILFNTVTNDACRIQNYRRVGGGALKMVLPVENFHHIANNVSPTMLVQYIGVASRRSSLIHWVDLGQKFWFKTFPKFRVKLDSLMEEIRCFRSDWAQLCAVKY